jgi:hypothetical protein
MGNMYDKVPSHQLIGMSKAAWSNNFVGQILKDRKLISAT